MNKMNVIFLKSEYVSYSWNDGLFAIQKEVDGIVYLWKIKDGKLARYDDGTPVITCTGVNNKSIIPTELFVYDTEESFKNENDFNSELSQEQEEKIKFIRKFEKMTGQTWTNDRGETFFEYIKRGLSSIKKDTDKTSNITEGREKTNTKTVDTPRPDVEPAPQNPKLLDVTIENLINEGYIKADGSIKNLTDLGYIKVDESIFGGLGSNKNATNNPEYSNKTTESIKIPPPPSPPKDRIIVEGKLPKPNNNY